MREIADVGAGALNDVLVGFYQCVEFLLQGYNLLRQGRLEPRGLPRTDRAQALFHLLQGKQPETDLEQVDGEQADAGEREREAEPGTEAEQAVFDLFEGGRDGHRVALRRLALAEHVNGFGNPDGL